MTPRRRHAQISHLHREYCSSWDPVILLMLWLTGMPGIFLISSTSVRDRVLVIQRGLSHWWRSPLVGYVMTATWSLPHPARLAYPQSLDPTSSYPKHKATSLNSASPSDRIWSHVATLTTLTFRCSFFPGAFFELPIHLITVIYFPLVSSVFDHILFPRQFEMTSGTAEVFH